MIKVSIVIPTYNRLDRLKQVLQGFEVQTYPFENFEVIVISDGSSDGTDEYLASFLTPVNLKIICQKNQGASTARNAGSSHAVGEYVLFVDDDVVPTPNLISEHMQLHAGNEATVVLGPMLTPSDFNMQPWVQWEQAMLVKQYDAMVTGQWEPTARQFYTGNTSLKRSFLLETGGFDPEITRAEDVELGYRLADLGVKFVFNMDAVGYHYAKRSLSSWMNIPYAYGRYDVIFAYEKGQSWLLRQLMLEFKQRNLFIRGITRLCLDRGYLSKILIWSLNRIAVFGYKIRFSGLFQKAYSGIFNLRYYQGVSDELGGRGRFFADISKVV